MKNFKNCFLIGLLGVAVLIGCEKDDDTAPCCDPSNPACSNYDPCFGKVATTAYFTIAQQYYPIGENANVFIEDDIVSGGTLKFTAIPQEGVTYTWLLGADTIVGGYEVTIPLGNLPEGIYGNSLTVSREPDSLCFPNDDGVDHFSRSFTRIDGCEAAFLGRFRGMFLNLEDSVDIELVGSSSIQSVQPCDLPSNSSATFSVNFRLENDTTRLYSDGGVNSRYSFVSLGTVGTATGEFIYDSSTNRAVATYSIDNVNYSFTGRKL